MLHMRARLWKMTGKVQWSKQRTRNARKHLWTMELQKTKHLHLDGLLKDGETVT